MDRKLRGLEREASAGDISALCQYVKESVRSDNNLYEWLPVFVENRCNADLRKVLRDHDLLGLSQYSRYDFMALDGRVIPTGNLLAFNHLMNEITPHNFSVILSEQIEFDYERYRMIISKGAQSIFIDGLNRNPITCTQSQCNKTREFLFGNLSGQYSDQRILEASYVLNGAGSGVQPNGKYNFTLNFIAWIGEDIEHRSIRISRTNIESRSIPQLGFHAVSERAYRLLNPISAL